MLTYAEPCYRCHRLTDGYHSGSYECWSCWTFRKLDRPAASHWRKVLLPLFSNIDYHDQMYFFPDAGTTPTMLNEAEQTLIYSLLLLRHGPVHTWDRETLNMIWEAPTNSDLLKALLNDSDLDIIRKAA